MTRPPQPEGVRRQVELARTTVGLQERLYPPGLWHYATPLSPAPDPDDLIGGDAYGAEFQNGWANVALPDASYSPLRWRFVTKGRVEIVGAIDGGTLGSVCVTLPSGFRPERDVVVACSSTDGSQVMTFSVSASTGEVTVIGAVTIGDGAVTTTKLADGSVTSEKLDATGVGVGTYGDATHVARVTVGADGRLSAVTSVAITFPSAYTPGGTDVALADGGTGASLADPNADRIMFWDDSAGTVTWLTLGTGLSITGTTINATAAGGIATDTLWDTKGDLAAASGADAAAKLPIGANDQVLVADSTQTLGMKWAAVPGTNAFVPVATIDAKGDLLVGTANDALDNLPVGADGQVLVADSAQTMGVKWASGGGSGLVTKLFDSILAVDTATIDTGAGGIAGGYDILEIWILAKTDQNAVIPGYALRFNNDSGTNYDQQTGYVTSPGTRGGGLATGQTSLTLQGQGSAANASQYAAIARVTIPGYATTAFYKTMETYNGAPGIAANASIRDASIGGWRNTAAITRVAIIAAGVTKFKAGSRMVCYGR